jgi:hypothetical protein
MKGLRKGRILTLIDCQVADNNSCLIPSLITGENTTIESMVQ